MAALLALALLALAPARAGERAATPSAQANVPALPAAAPAAATSGVGAQPKAPAGASTPAQAQGVEQPQEAARGERPAALEQLTETVGPEGQPASAESSTPRDRARQSLSYDKDVRSDDGEFPLPQEPSQPAAGAPALEPAQPQSGAPKAEPPAPAAPARGFKSRLQWLPNALTFGNAVSGLVALLSGGHGAIEVAAGAILAAAVFDFLDGWAARRVGSSDPKGIHLDSLADVVSFGAAPAVLLARAAGAGWWGLAAAAAVLIAGAYRLARFNVGALAESAGTKEKSRFFTGMPIPAGAGLVAGVVLALPLLGALAPWAAVIGGFVAAAAMASTLPYPAFKSDGFRSLRAPIAVAAVLTAGCALLGAPTLAVLAVFGGFTLTGPALWLWQGGGGDFRREAKRKWFHVRGLAWLLYVPAFHFFGWPIATALMFGVLAASGAVEWLRLKAVWAKPFFQKHFGDILREKEANRPSGTFYAALGLALSALLYGTHPAIMAGAVLSLFLGDAVSPLVGLRFGVGRYTAMGTKRSLDGTLAAFAVVLGIWLFVGLPFLAALGVALAFSLVDVLPLKPDDNFWIPLACSTAAFFLR